MMIKRLAIGVALASALAMGGCASNGQVTAQSVSTFVQATVCGLSASQAGVTGLETIQYKGAPLVDDRGQFITSLVYAASPVACKFIGGIVAAATPVAVPVGTPVAR